MHSSLAALRHRSGHPAMTAQAGTDEVIAGTPPQRKVTVIRDL
jgi:hypothetical protein